MLDPLPLYPNAPLRRRVVWCCIFSSEKTNFGYRRRVFACTFIRTSCLMCFCASTCRILRCRAKRRAFIIVQPNANVSRLSHLAERFADERTLLRDVHRAVARCRRRSGRPPNVSRVARARRAGGQVHHRLADQPAKRGGTSANDPRLGGGACAGLGLAPGDKGAAGGGRTSL